MTTTLHVADRAALAWAQRRIAAEHYLHAPIDPRCRRYRSQLAAAGATQFALI